jgi:hypothetical protein
VVWRGQLSDLDGPRGLYRGQLTVHKDEFAIGELGRGGLVALQDHDEAAVYAGGPK